MRKLFNTKYVIYFIGFVAMIPLTACSGGSLGSVGDLSNLIPKGANLTDSLALAEPSQGGTSYQLVPSNANVSTASNTRLYGFYGPE